MAQTIYTTSQGFPATIQGVESFDYRDVSLIESFEVNSLFTPSKHYIELYGITTTGDILYVDSNYINYKLLGNAGSAGQEGSSVITVNPVDDYRQLYTSFDNGVRESPPNDIQLLYHFLNDLYSDDTTPTNFYIKEISGDRTELKLATLDISPEGVSEFTGIVKAKLENEVFFNEFRLSFGDNDLLIGLNIDMLESEVDMDVVVKLYEPLPITYSVRSQLRVVEIIADSAAYNVNIKTIEDPVAIPTISSPNFNIEIQDDTIIPTQYYNYNELFSYPINNTNSEIYSIINEKGIEVSVDYTDYSNFIHFSSAQERLVNFKYKLELIQTYSSSLSLINIQTVSLQGVSGSTRYYESLIEGIVSNFDHYERHLYYESGSSSWPKSNNRKPYINKESNTSDTILWYANQTSEAISFDNSNNNSLELTIPSYLREDSDNQRYLTFIYMIGQHFDNLWLYASAVTDKYDADNRVNRGISKDLVAEALKNFGVKLYTSNKSIEDLFYTIIGDEYQSGQQHIVDLVTGSLAGTTSPIHPTSFDSYEKEIYKRIYHNLPFLVKSKGTERGLRALINCFGIPSDLLDIKVYGGRNTNERPYYGDTEFYTSSLDKIRLDNTGSIIPGNTLSELTSIIKRDSKYTDDIHPIEVGFSPTDNINRFIISKSLADPVLANFNIDDYIGDPRDLTTDKYDDLYDIGEEVLGNLPQYNVFEFVRLIKFFDNTIFRMIKDFIPARSIADTGIIIKPNILNRSKARSVKAIITPITGSGINNAFIYTSSIDTVFTEGKHGNTFGSIVEYKASYSELKTTPVGNIISRAKSKEEAKYDGELSNSSIRVTDGELNRNNTLKKIIVPKIQYRVQFYKELPEAICTLEPNNTTQIVNTTTTYQLSDLFETNEIPVPSSTQYFLGTTNSALEIISPYTFTGDQYQVINIFANAGAIDSIPCQVQKQFRIVQCTIDNSNTANIPPYIRIGEAYNLNEWFSLNENLQVMYNIYIDDSPPETIDSTQAQAYSFNSSDGIELNDNIKVEIVDLYDNTCKKEVSLNAQACPFQPGIPTVLLQGSRIIDTVISTEGETRPLFDPTIDFPGAFPGDIYSYQLLYEDAPGTTEANPFNPPSSNEDDWSYTFFYEDYGIINKLEVPTLTEDLAGYYVRVQTPLEGCQKIVRYLKPNSAPPSTVFNNIRARSLPFQQAGNYGTATNEGAFASTIGLTCDHNGTNQNLVFAVFYEAPFTIYLQGTEIVAPDRLLTLWNQTDSIRLWKRNYSGTPDGQHLPFDPDLGDEPLSGWISDSYTILPYFDGYPATTILNENPLLTGAATNQNGIPICYQGAG